MSAQHPQHSYLSSTWFKPSPTSTIESFVKLTHKDLAFSWHRVPLPIFRPVYHGRSWQGEVNVTRHGFKAHQPIRHQSPLHRLFAAYDLDPTSTETIPTFHRSTKWTRSFATIIAENKEQAAAQNQSTTEKDRYIVYTDGSALGGRVGAAAVLYRIGQQTATLRYHLGSENHHTVYEAELVGIALGAHLLCRMTQLSDTIIYCDNQAAIRATNHSKARSAHRHLDKIDLEIEKQREAGGNRLGRVEKRVTLAWVPGHVGIRGNEAVDKEHKKNPLIFRPGTLGRPPRVYRRMNVVEITLAPSSRPWTCTPIIATPAYLASRLLATPLSFSLVTCRRHSSYLAPCATSTRYRAISHRHDSPSATSSSAYIYSPCTYCI